MSDELQDASGGFRISVIICTHNRAELLRGCLNTLLRQTLDPFAYEVLVVDNASSDDTGTVVAELKARHISAAVVLEREPRLGLSHARNTGVRQARSSILAFVDDDVLVPEHWLAHGMELFERLGKSVVGIGGPEFPRYLVTPPDWFLDRYETASWGAEARYLVRGESFFGGNMIFRREALEQVGGFPEHLGMSGATMGYGEETGVYYRLWEQDKAPKLYYSPDLYVFHCIPPWKTSVAYCLRRGIAVGQSAPDLQSSVSAGTVRWIRKTSRALVNVLWGSARAIISVYRHHRWQRWAVEELEPVVVALGRLAKCLGSPIKLRQRPDASQ